jgi:hypothetical protein
MHVVLNPRKRFLYSRTPHCASPALASFSHLRIETVSADNNARKQDGGRTLDRRSESGHIYRARPNSDVRFRLILAEYVPSPLYSRRENS